MSLSPEVFSPFPSRLPASFRSPLGGRLAAIVPGLALLLAGVGTHSACADTTYTTYTATPSNFTQTVQDNSNPPYAGFYTSGTSNLGLYANGGSGGIGSDPQAVAFRTLTSDGTNSGSTAVPLQVGQSITITLSLSGSQGINGNSIGFSLNNGTAASTTTNYNTGGRFELSFTGGDTYAAVYDNGGKETTGVSYGDFSGGQTYTLTLVSANEYNFTASDGDATINIGKLSGTSGAAINSFSLFNRGYNNSDATFAPITVTNLSTITLTAASGTTSNVTGVISNNSTTGTNSITKSGSGTVVLQANNTFSGTTTISAGTLQIANDNGATTSGQLSGTSNITINSGGTLLLSGSSAVTDRINNSATFTLNGGTFNTGGLKEGAASTPGIGALTLQASSVLDLSTTGSLVAFADSHGATWTGGAKLSIYDYTPGSDSVYFGSTSSALTSTQLSQIEFYSGAGTGDLGSAGILASGQIVPVPEPATWLAGLLICGLVGCSQRRRLRGLLCQSA
jgi:fibronectin-binding autotransporter adhesin